MTWLETRFRRQFRPDGDGYVVERRGREVRFTAAEVAEFVEEWRRLWLAPWFWTGWLMLGVIAPAWTWMQGYSGAAFVVGILANLFVIVVLMPVWQKPGEAAESRLPFEPDAPVLAQPPAWWQILLFGLVLVGTALDVVRTGGDDLSAWNRLILWSALFLGMAWQRYQYGRGRWMAGEPDMPGLLIFGGASIAIAALTILNPDRGMIDIAMAWVMPVMFVLIAGFAMLKRLRSKPAA